MHHCSVPETKLTRLYELFPVCAISWQYSLDLDDSMTITSRPLHCMAPHTNMHDYMTIIYYLCHCPALQTNLCYFMTITSRPLHCMAPHTNIHDFMTITSCILVFIQTASCICPAAETTDFNGIAVTAAGFLPSSNIIHVDAQHYDNNWEEIVERILFEADSLHAKSVAVPALGTGTSLYPVWQTAPDVILLMILIAILIRH